MQPPMSPEESGSHPNSTTTVSTSPTTFGAIRTAKMEENKEKLRQLLGVARVCRARLDALRADLLAGNRTYFHWTLGDCLERLDEADRKLGWFIRDAQETTKD